MGHVTALVGLPCWYLNPAQEAAMRSMSNGHGNSFSNGPSSPPLTITGVQCGAAQDDRWGNGPGAATA